MTKKVKSEGIPGKKASRRFGNNKQYKSKEAKFKGACIELSGKIFDNKPGGRAEQFNNTLKAIANYAGNQYKYGAYVRASVMKLEIFTVELPNDSPENAT